jgi:hypothetical protein
VTVQPPSECSPHFQHQPSRRPVIVSASELAQNTDVSPLIQQLTSGGELEVTLSTPPTSSSASSDSGIGSSSHRTSSDAEQSEVMRVSIKAVHGAVSSARKGQYHAEEGPRDSPSHQPLQPESSSFSPREPVPTYMCNRGPPGWPGGKCTQTISLSYSGFKIPVQTL